mgnify:FL=1
MTDQPTGRALAEAAARAMNQRAEPTARRCVEWLGTRWLEGLGPEVRDALMRLVVAVADREAGNGR